MDIIDFVQNVCDWQLSEFQIKFTRAAYDAIENDKTFIYTLHVEVLGFNIWHCMH